MAEIDDRGQSLTLRTRRGADLRFELFVGDANSPDPDDPDPIDLTGAVLVSRIYAPGQPGFLFGYTLDGPAGTFVVQLTAAQTLNMSQDWEYVIAYKLDGIKQPLLFGPLYVTQDQI